MKTTTKKNAPAVIFSLLMIAFFPPNKVQAQAPEIKGPLGVTPNTCILIDEPGEVYELTPTTGITVTGWSVRGDLAIVSQSGAQVTVASVSTRANEPASGKGRLTCHYIVDDEEICGQRSVSLDIYKEFSANPLEDTIVGPRCVELNETVTYSINPRVSVNPQHEIGIDSYKWIVPSGWTIEFYSGDSSSITVTANTIDVNDKIIVGTGRCNFDDNNEYTDTLFIGRATELPDFLIEPATCITTDESEVTVKIDPDNGVTYRWELSNPAWNYVKGTNANSQDSVVINIGTSAGTITLYANGGCDEVSRTFVINRSLGKRTSIEGDTCVARNAGYFYSIQPFPNTEIAWDAPDGWVIDANNPNSQIVNIYAGPDAVSGYIYASTVSCEDGKDSLYVYVRPDNLVSESLTGETYLERCDIAQLSYSVDAADNASGYGWIFPQGWSPRVTTTLTPSVNVIPDGKTGGYVQVYAEGCINSDTVSLAVDYEILTAPDDIMASAACANANMLDTLTFEIETPGTGTSYGWKIPRGWEVIAFDDSDSTEITVKTNGVSGNHTVSAWKKDTCGTSDTISIQIPINALSFVINKEDFGAFVVFRSNPDPVSGATFYRWTQNGTLMFQGANQSSAVAIGTVNYPVCLEVTNSAGCITRECIYAPTMRQAPASSFSEKESEDIHIFPNPASDWLTIQFYSEVSHEVRLVNSRGVEVVANQKVETEKLDLHIGDLPKDTYYAIISSELGISVKRVQISR